MRYFFQSLLLLLALPAFASADIVEYRIPNTSLVVVLQGKATVNPGRTVSFNHPKFGKLVFDLRDTSIHKTPSTSASCRRSLNRAVATGDAEQVMEASRFAPKHGLLPMYYEAVNRVLQLEPNHEVARRVVKLKKQIDQPLGDSSKQEAYLRQLVDDPAMKIAKSKHFVLLHDTPDKPAPNRRKPRAQERLDLLELVYESFLQKFCSQGSLSMDVDVPQEYLMAVLYQEHADYLRFATSQHEALQSAAGYWDSNTNVSVFYDQGTHDAFRVIKDVAKQLQQAKEDVLRRRSSGAKDIVRMANTFSVLSEITQENSDIEVVTHEATHQMAGNTGLLPRHVQIPAWVHEGLATYFEAPKDATWSGMGAVNEERLGWYRALERDTEHSNIDFIVGDQIFSYAFSHGAKLHGYGQAWALTHFLMEKHFDRLMTFYERLGQLPPDIRFSPSLLTKLFNEVFGEDRRALDAEWRRYMRGLKTDLSQVLES